MQRFTVGRVVLSERMVVTTGCLSRCCLPLAIQQLSGYFSFRKRSLSTLTVPVEKSLEFAVNKILTSARLPPTTHLNPHFFPNSG